MILILEFSRALGETADGPAELFDHEGVRVIAPVRPYHGARPEKYFVDGAPAFLDRPAPEKQPAPQLILLWLTSASPGGFHDWKTLYPSGAQINVAALLRLRLNDLHAIDADGARLTG